MRLATVWTVAVLLFAGVAGSRAETPAALAAVRNRMASSDYRASGQLVRVDANGNRTRFAIAVEGLWFHGALHTLIEAVPPRGAADAKNLPLRILLEVRPDGRDSIRIFQPHAAGPELLPPAKWGEPFLGTVFSYEDLLDPQYFWPEQTLLGSASFGGRTCDLLQSTPGPSDRTRYSTVRTWLDHTIAYPIHAEKTLRQGGAVKEITYYGLRQSNGVWSATQIEAKMRGQAGSTLWIVKRGSAKAHLGINDFQPGPIGHLKDRP